MAETDTDGYNRPVGLATIAAGSTILVRAANGTAMDLLLTGTPTDNGTYWTLPVSVTTGTVTKGARTQLNFVAASSALTTEDAVDAVAAALVAGNNIDITYNDAAGTITVDVEALTTADVTGLDTALAGKQPLDAELTTIAGLTATSEYVIQSVGGSWAAHSPAQLKTTLALVKGDVGLGNVDNTADTAKPVSTATQTALDAKLAVTTAATTYAPIRRTVKADTTTATPRSSPTRT